RPDGRRGSSDKSGKPSSDSSLRASRCTLFPERQVVTMIHTPSSGSTNTPTPSNTGTVSPVRTTATPLPTTSRRYTPSAALSRRATLRDRIVPALLQQVLESHGEARTLQNGPNAEQHARHERGPIQRVVSDRQRLPRAAEEDLLVSDKTG